jgi:translation elongation factor EF-Ts
MSLFRPATRLTARTTTTRTFVTSVKALKDNKGNMESAGETLKQAGQAFKVG